jgi:FkbM family methyltransferase
VVLDVVGSIPTSRPSISPAKTAGVNRAHSCTAIPYASNVSRFSFSVLHRAGLRRAHLAHPIIRDIARLLCRKRIIPLELLIGAPVNTTFRVAIDGLAFRYRLDADDIFGSRLFWSGASAFEPDTVPLFVKYARTAPRVIDVGAHTGFYTLLAAAANPACELISFEPFAATFGRLRENLAVNNLGGRCVALESAVSDKAGTAFLHVPDDKSMVAVDATAGNIPVTTTPLDAIIPRDGNTRVVKIDVEGHELAVLRGMEETLADSHPVIFFECNPGGPAASIDRFLRSKNYRIFSIVKGNVRELRRLVPEDIPHQHHNFLALSSQDCTTL